MSHIHNTTPHLAGGAFNPRIMYGAVDILGSYRGYSAATIKAAMTAVIAETSLSEVDPEDPTVSYTVDEYDRINDRDEARQLARRALAALTPREREVVEYRYGFRGYPLLFQSVAAVLGVTEGTVKALHHRALGKMRDALGAV